MSSPWFPFYVGDYLRDTARLTTEGHGAYLLLILDYWANGAPPDDDATLSSIARLSLPAWLALRERIAVFFDVSDGVWKHGRIEKELKTASEKHQKRVEAGKRGGEAKAIRQQSSSNATDLLPAKLYQPQPQPQPLEDEELRAVADATRPRAPDRFDDFWRAYPRRDGANPRAPAEKRFRALVKSGVDPEMMIAAASKLASEEGAKGNVGTAFIPQAMTWLNQKRWSDHAAVAFMVAEQDPEKQLEAAVSMWARMGRWSRYAGPEPGVVGCRASAELLAKHGLGVDGLRLREAV